MENSKYSLPEDFLKRIASQIEDIDSFVDSLNGVSPTFIRVNRHKLNLSDAHLEGTSVEWNDDGILLSARPRFNQDPLYHAGLYYPMEGSSMFLKHALSSISLDEDALILDLCAAPGGKTLILKDYFPHNVLVSNEIDGKRAHVLKENAVRWGTDEHLVINSYAERLQRSDLLFDLILVDAPCSGEGLFRKDEKSREEWTLDRAAGCAVRQVDILDHTLDLLSSGGYLIYSTCTYNPDENINQIKRLINEGYFECIEIDIPDDWGIDRMESDGAVGYQFWPHHIKGEGFFISIIRNKGHKEKQELPRTKRLNSAKINSLQGVDLKDKTVVDQNGQLFAFTEREWTIYNALLNSGKVVKKGLYLGEFKGKDFIPSHDLACHPAIDTFTPTLELDSEQALFYLKGNALAVQAEKGVIKLTFQGISIGFGKSNGQRINNLIPKHLRIH